MDFLNQGLAWVIRFCDQFTNNYALSLLFFALVIKIVLFPLGIKQQKNMVKQAKLRPREMAIRKKYAGRNDQATQQKAQQEIMELYQAENFNPMGGCLPMLIQLPILFALYGVITKPLTYLCRFSQDTITKLSERVNELMGTAADAAGRSAYSVEISTINSMRELGFEKFADIEGFAADNIPNFEIFGGMNLANIPSFKEFSWLLLIPLFTLVFTFLSSKITKKLSYQAPSAEGAANNSSMKIMEYSMPLLSTYICFTVPATIGLYWIFQNVFSVVQTIILAKMYPIPKFTEEDYKAAEKAVGADKKSKKAPKNTDPNRPKVRSLHHIDDDEYEEIYGKKNNNTEKPKKAEVIVEKAEEAVMEAPAENQEVNKSDAPVIKDDGKTKYKKKDN